MPWLFPSIVSSLCGTIILLFVYVYLYATYRERFMAIWAVSWGIYALRFIANLTMLAWGISPFLLFVSEGSTIVSAYLLLFGTALFIRSRTHIIWIWVAGFALIWTAIGIYYNFSFLLLTIPAYAITASIYIWMGGKILKADLPSGIGKTVTAGAIILWGLHKADYPFLRHIDWFAPWGFILGGILSVVVALGMVLVYFEKTRRELINAEETSIESEIMLSSIINSTSDYIWSVDIQDFRLLTFNTGMQNFFTTNLGVDLKQGMTPDDVFADRNFAEMWNNIYRNVISKGYHSFEYTTSTGNNIIYYDLNLLKHGDTIFGISAFGRDITEQKHAEKALLKSHQLLKSTFDSLREAVFIIDFKTTAIIDCNVAATEIFGYRREDMIGKSTEFLHINQDALGEFRKHLSAGIAEKGYLFLPEFSMKRKDGTIFPTEHSIIPHIDEQVVQIGWVSVVRDITEQKMIEKALNESEDKYRYIVENAPIGIFQRNLEGQFNYCNKTLAKHFECNSIDEFLQHYNEIPKRWANPDKYAEFKELLVKNGKVLGFEVETKLINGKTKWFSLYAYFNTTNSELNSFSLDITEQKLAEKALKKSEIQYYDAIESLPVPIGIALGDKIVHFNKEFIKTYGYTLNDVSGISQWMEIVYPDPVYREDVVRIWGNDVANAIQTKTITPQREYLLTCKDLSVKWVAITAALVGDQLISTFENITERKKAEEEIKFQNILLKTNQELSLDGILIVDEKGNILSNNKNFQEIWEIPQEVIDSKSDEKAYNSVLSLLPDPQAFLEKVEYLYRVKTEKSFDEIQLINGKFLERYSAPMLSDLGQYFGRIWFFRDITERKKIENAIKEKNEEFEALNEELIITNTDLRNSENSLSKSVREKETLIREIYHRTKNTMQVIRGMIVLQADEYPSNIEIQQLVKNTEIRIQSISLVHQMLYQSQDLSQISIKDYVHELSARIMQSFGISTDRISLNIEIDEQKFLLDTAIPFGLLFNELMTNSLKYAFPDNKKGAINISLSKGESDINVLHYSDNGIGFPDEFDFRKQSTLGLQLIYGIGEKQMMGKVTMENKNGLVCVFEFQNNLYQARV